MKIIMIIIVLALIFTTSCFEKLEYYTVSFDSNNGSTPSFVSKVVSGGGIYGNLPTTDRDNYTFNGWWTGADGTGTKISSSSKVTIKKNHTLYAYWVKNYLIGERGPSGGYIFFDKGNYDNEWRYLEAAPSFSEWRNKIWGGEWVLVGGTSSSIGTGKTNTQRIVEM
jgi:uncharacterized repeat protein (TIGR02543 family)